MPDPTEIDLLMKKLKAARFAGILELRFEAGLPASAKLIHFLPFSELSRELPGIEPETDFKLTP
jgi:hypothetical protein